MGVDNGHWQGTVQKSIGEIRLKVRIQVWIDRKWNALSEHQVNQYYPIIQLYNMVHEIHGGEVHIQFNIQYSNAAYKMHKIIHLYMNAI